MYHTCMTIRVLTQPITRAELQEIANERFGDLVKGVVDIRKGKMAVGPEMHADAQTLLIETEGSTGEDTWGINLYPADTGEGFLEFDSLINLKPAFGNRSRGVEDADIRAKIDEIVARFISDR